MLNSKQNEAKKELFGEYPDLVNVKDLMQMLRIGKTLAYKILKDKRLKFYNINGTYLITKESILELLSECEVGR